MSTQSLYIWILLLIGVVFANLPFLANRLFAWIPLKRGKTTTVRFTELALYYAIWVALGMLMEHHLSSITTVSWEFYPITACLFLVFGYPGFVIRYLRKRNRIVTD